MNTLWAMMNDPARATLWAALQDFLLVVSAILIWGYLVETRRMRKAAQEQISTSQELTKVGHQQVAAAYEQLAAIREQVAVAQDQLEGQISPAIVARVERNGIEVLNIGSGPAIRVQLSAVDKGSGPNVAVREALYQIAFLEAKQSHLTSVMCTGNPVFPGAPDLRGRSLQCTYKSLSGRRHYTVVDFEEDGPRVEDTRFYEREPDQ
jgi:hypothetical protein